MLQIDVISIFPEYLSPLKLSLLGKAQDKGLVSINIHDLRDQTNDVHKSVDDTPYGGGAGMVMTAEPWAAAIDQITNDQDEVDLIILTPAGEKFNQKMAETFANKSHLIFACGRYEGIDARVGEYYAGKSNFKIHQVSIGDYVLGGGEVAAMVIIEATTRLIPGVLGNPDSLKEESHSITGANDVAIPLQNGAEVAHLIPQNIAQWSDGLGIDPEQVGIYLSLREAAAARLFANNKWLSKYIQDVITAYGKGISIDVESITRQAEEAMASGEIDINNPNAINIALNSGLFTPQQTPAQELALTKLEMALALIEGWIDHVISEVASERMPAFNALIENSRRRRATNSPMQQIFATLLALEVSPRKMREASAFWSEVKQLRGTDGRDKCWQDAAFLPMPDDLKDVKAFLDSVTVPDDLSGLL